MRFSERPVLYRVRRGVEVGLAISVALCLWAALAYSLKNAAQQDAMNLTLRQAIVSYLA